MNNISFVISLSLIFPFFIFHCSQKEQFMYIVSVNSVLVFAVSLFFLISIVIKYIQVLFKKRNSSLMKEYNNILTRGKRTNKDQKTMNRIVFTILIIGSFYYYYYTITVILCCSLMFILLTRLIEKLYVYCYIRRFH